MELLKCGVGIDMAMQKFDVCFSVIDSEQRVTIKATHKFENNPKGFVSFLGWVKKHHKQPIPIVFVVEASGVYHEQLAWYLFEQNKSVSVILPNKAKSYKEALGIKSKTDKLDAKALAQMVCEQRLKLWQPASKNLYQLRTITRQIERITYHITSFQNQLHALEHGMYREKMVEKMITKNIALLEKQKEELVGVVETMIKGNAVLNEHFSQIGEIKGLGLLTFAVLVAETDGFALIENQSQLVSYAGYDVVENQSGKHTGKTKISKKGNGHIRRALHMPAFNVVRYEQKPFVSLYERVYENSKIKMKAYTAVQKKLLILVYTLWKKNEMYQPDYVFKTSREEELEPSFG